MSSNLVTDTDVPMEDTSAQHRETGIFPNVGEHAQLDVTKTESTAADETMDSSQPSGSAADGLGASEAAAMAPNESVDSQPPAYQPTPEEVEAATLFDQHNDGTASEVDAEEHAMTAQEIADFELALTLQNDEEFQRATDEVADQDHPPESQECACGEVFEWRDFGKLVWLSCGHVRCPPCFNENVRVGLECKKNYPPRCCTPIDLEVYEAYLEPDVKQRCDAVKAEYGDVAPVYCGTKSCSVYLPKSTITADLKWATCAACTTATTTSSSSENSPSPPFIDSAPSSTPSSTIDRDATQVSPIQVRTCTGCLCLESDHKEVDKCPERIDQMDKDLMVKEGWKPCPACKEMIEKEDGCDHMQCECGHEFCYQCGRSYTGGMPCNCHGRNAWVDDVDEEENDPDVQQELLDGFAGGAGLEDDGNGDGNGDGTGIGNGNGNGDGW